MADARDTEERTALRDLFARSRRGELFVILASGLAGFLSLAVSTYNVYLQRAQVRAQVWPSVEWLYSESDGFEWNASNAGVGPAKIVGVRVSIGDRDFKNWRDVDAFLESRSPHMFDDSTMETSTLVGRVLPPGGAIHAYHRHFASEGLAPERRQALQTLVNPIVDICYCSTLDDCWMSHEGDPAPISSCPTTWLTFRN